MTDGDARRVAAFLLGECGRPSPTASPGAAVLLLVVGTALHASGMWNKHHLERSVGQQTLWWETVLFWVCWALLGGLVIYVVVSRYA